MTGILSYTKAHWQEGFLAGILSDRIAPREEGSEGSMA